jgi:hypothetical protein
VGIGVGEWELDGEWESGLGVGIGIGKWELEGEWECG